MNAVKSRRGFTLIELLVALSIFAVLSLISYRALGGLFTTREQLNTETAKWRDLALFFARVDNDLAAVINRPIRTADDRTAAALCLNAFTPVGNDAALSFTRSGFVDVAMQQDGTASPQRIGYRQRESAVEWMLWPALDQAPRAVPQTFAALENIREAKWRALDRSNNWRSDWPPAPATCAQPDKNAPPLPQALELAVTLASGETVTRVFALRRVQ
jgi:general secretion pathway protein J